MNMDIKKRLTQIESEIRDLELERTDLNKQLMGGASTFEEKFRAWWTSPDKEEWDYLPDESDFPATIELFNSFDMTRHKTYDVVEYLEDSLEFLLQPQRYADEVKADPEYADTDEKIQRLRCVAHELMSANLGSFTCDW